MRKLFILIVLSFFFHPLYAQEFSLGQELYEKGQYDSAASVFEKVAQKARQNRNAIKYWKSLHFRALALNSLGRYDEARPLAEENASFAKRRLTDKPLYAAASESDQALIAMTEGRTDLAEKLLEKALLTMEKYAKAEAEDQSLLAEALSYQAVLFWQLGRREEAESHANRALEIRLRYLKADDPQIAASYNDLGLIMSSASDESAFGYYRKALKAYTDHYGTEHPKTAGAYNNIGIIQQRRKEYDQALDNYEKSLDIRKKLYGEEHPNIAFVLNSIGQLHFEQGDYEQSSVHHEKALKIYEKLYGTNHPEIASTRNLIGSVLMAQKKHKEALAMYQNAVKANIQGFEPSDTETIPELKNYQNAQILLTSFSLKAAAFNARHEDKTLKPKHLKQALAHYKACVHLIEQIRSVRNTEADKLALNALSQEVFHEGQRIALRLAEGTLGKRKYSEEAFFFAEKNKGAVLQEAIADTRAKNFAGIPLELLEKERSLKAGIADYEQRLRAESDLTKTTDYRQKLFELKSRYREFTKMLENSYPDYYKLKFSSEMPSVSEIQSKLQEGTTLLSYSTTKDRLYIYLISNKHFEVIDKALPEDYNKLIKGLRNAIYYRVQKVFTESAVALHELLIPKLPKEAKHLVLVPEGTLGTVPFDVLLTEAPKSTSYSSMPFLLRKYALSMSYSASLAVDEGAASKSMSNKAVLVAPVSFKQPGLNSLPATALEVQDISGLFEAESIEAEVLTEKQTEESKVLKSLSDCRFIHMATHGEVNQETPEQSRVFLRADDSEDGSLFVGEIYNLSLNAELVTLSACETGLGKVSSGEGVIGLTRALLYAGAEKVVVSLWKVTDNSTAKLMTDFYRQALKSKTTLGYSEALRQAKLSMIEEKDFNEPYYWSAFIAVGH